jgi:hypothetical protein
MDYKGSKLSAVTRSSLIPKVKVAKVFLGVQPGGHSAGTEHFNELAPPLKQGVGSAELIILVVGITLSR